MIIILRIKIDWKIWDLESEFEDLGSTFEDLGPEFEDLGPRDKQGDFLKGFILLMK